MITDFSLESKATRWGEAILASAATQIPIDYVVNSTFNEKYDVLASDHIGTTSIPVIKWIGLGVGSDYMAQLTHPTSGAVIDNPTPYIHSNEDAIPFIPFPFLMRKEGEDDLTSTERAKYAMRYTVTIDGISYVCYMLRRVDVTNDKVTSKVVTVNGNGEITDISPLEASTAPLNPTRDKNYTGESSSSNEYLRVRAPLALTLDPSDIAELINCANIIFGASDIEITEFALVGGISKTTAVVDGTNNIGYTEVIGAQTTHFSPVSFSASQRLDTGISVEFKIGQSMATS